MTVNGEGPKIARAIPERSGQAAAIAPTRDIPVNRGAETMRHGLVSPPQWSIPARSGQARCSRFLPNCCRAIPRDEAGGTPFRVPTTFVLCGAGDAGDLGDGGLGDAELEEVTDFILLAVES